MLIDVHQSDAMGNVYTLKEPLYYRELVVPVGVRIGSVAASGKKHRPRELDNNQPGGEGINEWKWRKNEDGKN